MSQSHNRITDPHTTEAPQALVSPFYHEARNEIVRPDRGLLCTDYFLTQWAPHLGATAVLIVLFLRTRGSEVRIGEACVQVNQQEIARVAGCSLTTLYREFRNNDSLRRFVRTEERYARGEKGHVRQVENVYWIAMDDPLIPEDMPRLEALIAEREQSASAQKPGKVILPDNVVFQNERLRQEHVVFQNEGQCRDDRSFKMKDNRSFKMKDYLVTETNQYRNVSETRFRGEIPETDQGHTSKKPAPSQPENTTPSGDPAETWRKETEDLARHSARELDDLNSLGFHITVWHHARKIDRRQGKQTAFTNGIFDILQQLSDRRRQTNQPQGKAWTRRTRKWFTDMGAPLLVKADQAELEEVRSLLQDAPFLNGPEPEVHRQPRRTS